MIGEQKEIIEISNNSVVFQLGTMLTIIITSLTINMANKSINHGIPFLIIGIIFGISVMTIYNKIKPWNIPDKYTIGGKYLLINTNEGGGKFTFRIQYENIHNIKLRRLFSKKSIWIRYASEERDNDLFIVSGPGLIRCNDKIEGIFNSISERRAEYHNSHHL